MITIYSYMACQNISHRNILKFLNDRKIKYKLVNMEFVTRGEIVEILQKSRELSEVLKAERQTKNGVKGYNQLLDIKFSELIDYIMTDFSILKSPIIMVHGHLFVGFSEGEMERVIQIENYYNRKIGRTK